MSQRTTDTNRHSFLKGRKFKAGDVIVTASPYAHIVSMKANGSYCDWCCFPPAEGQRLLKCTACNYEHYCNKACQKKAWKYHKFECPLIKKRYPRIASDSSRLLTKILWNVYNGIQRPENDPGWRSFYDLCDNFPDFTKDELRMQQFTELHITVTNYLDVAECRKILPEPQTILHLFGRMIYNGFTLTHMDQEIGAAIYISPSVFDHSCSPNAVFVCNGSTVNVRAIRDIDSSSEVIYVNYIDPMQSTRQRKAQLLKDYLFECRCSKCTDVSDSALSFEALICPECKGNAYELANGIFKCKTCLKEVDDPSFAALVDKTRLEAVRICDEATKHDSNLEVINSFLARNKVLADSNVLISMLMANLYADESQFGDTRKAYEIGEKVTKLFGQHYPEYFPPHGVHQFKQGRLAWHLGEHDKALRHYTEAVKHLLVTHGQDHYYVREVQRDIIDCNMDRPGQ